MDSQLITQSINYHGHQLLKDLTANHPEDIKDLNLQDVTYKEYQSRVPKIFKGGTTQRQALLEFITSKADQVFQQPLKNEPPQRDEFHIKDKYEHLVPLEYYMGVSKDVKKALFLENVKRGDLLVGVVERYTKKYSVSGHYLKLKCTDGGENRDISDLDIKAFLSSKDTTPLSPDAYEGCWIFRTLLRVEVLEVDHELNTLKVGTKGVAASAEVLQMLPLGKINTNKLPAILTKMQEKKTKSFEENLERTRSFQNPRSIKDMSSRVGINLFQHSSFMESLRYRFQDKEMFRTIRKAQMNRWALKSVADGVAFFKKGQHEEAFQCLNKALQIDDENVEAFVAKGALLANLGQFEKAVEDFEQALKFNPKHANARKYICETLVELGKQVQHLLLVYPKIVFNCMQLHDMMGKNSTLSTFFVAHRKSILLGKFMLWID